MTPERQAAIRSALEQDDPALYRPGNFSARHDYDVKWELLEALDEAQEQLRFLKGLLYEVREGVPEFGEEWGYCDGGCSVRDLDTCRKHDPTCLWSRIDTALEVIVLPPVG